MMPYINEGRLASARGFANEQRLLAALLARGFNASRVDLPHSTYDIIVELEPDNLIRVQVKTIGEGGSISFIGGVRGGVDREYRSGVKEYTQSSQTSDIVVGVQCELNNGDAQVDFFFVPTLFIEKLGQKSLSINKIQATKNNWEILKKCKDKAYIEANFATFKISFEF